MGATVGGLAGNALSTIFGMGEYAVKKNSLTTNSTVPAMHSTSSNVRICHREYLQDITATNAFSIQSFDINPGLSQSFPYLAGIARNFESYRIHGMVYMFKSQSADALNSTNTALGTMIMATKYDALGIDFNNKQGMEATQFSSSARPSESQIHPIECAPSLSSSPQKYIRSGDLTSAQGDQRLYDWGKFFIASQGQQATSVVGELWVSYDIEFINPLSTVPRGLSIPTDKWQLSGVTDAAPIGAAATPNIHQLGIVLTPTSLRIPANSYGLYFVSYAITGSPIVGLALTVTPTTNVTAPPYMVNGTANGVSNAGSTSATFLLSYYFHLTDPTQAGVITFSGATLPASAVSGDLQVTQINGGLL